MLLLVEITAITNAISLLTQLKQASENIRNAEFKNLLADLSLELAEVKMKMAGLMNEKLELENKIKELEKLKVILVRDATNVDGKSKVHRNTPCLGELGCSSELTSARFVDLLKTK